MEIELKEQKESKKKSRDHLLTQRKKDDQDVNKIKESKLQSANKARKMKFE